MKKQRPQTLRQWCDEYGDGAISQLQRETGLAYTTVWRAVHAQKITPATAKRICAATGGRVRWEDLV